MSNWFFFYQRKGGEDKWELELADKRQEITDKVAPAFVSVLDLTHVPDDNDWSKVRYRGPMYFDFDADGDLDRACEQFQAFLGKLDADLSFDLMQAKFFASGGKGFHVEIPQECFLPKVPPAGITWLPYIYRAVAETLVLDTMDLRVYTGKRGRMWRTPGVQRESGTYKVPLTIEESMAMTPDLYRELIASPRTVDPPAPASCNSALAMRFNAAREKVQANMRGKKKRVEKANAFLDPWKKAKKHPPTIEGIMSGEIVADGVGFQALSMQIAIYATSVDMPLEEMIERCRGLCENHVSDSHRYNSPTKRREELARMYRYMAENSLYEFDVGPIARLVKPGVSINDLGVLDTEDKDDEPSPSAMAESDHEDDGTPAPEAGTPTNPLVDLQKGVRRGFFMNADGMFKKEGDTVHPMCRATLRKVECFYDAESREFHGYEFDIVVKGKKLARTMLAAEVFASASNMKKFFVANQLSYQGGEPETAALLDIMAEKASRGGRVYTYPREGFFILNNPECDEPTPVKVYLTKEQFFTSVPEDSPDFFRLRYRPVQAVSSYNIDVHRAPELDESFIEPLKDLFQFSRPDVVADLLGWMVACHYRSAYLYLFNQFPLLQVYGEAGAGKSQSVWMLAHLHWYLTEISMKSASSCTRFALDTHASTSTSAPFILDEYKPREMRSIKGRHENIKDVLKASYICGDIGERGTVNRGAENNLGIIKNKATAPIVFLGEAIEMETAIIERSVSVNLTKAYQTRQRVEAFNRLHSDPTCLSALGRRIVEMGFGLNLETMREEVRMVQAQIEASMPTIDDEHKRRAAPRMIYNRAVIIHALHTLKRALQSAYGSEFDASVDELLAARAVDDGNENHVITISAMSEISKVISRIALMTRDTEAVYAPLRGKDYVIGDGWVEIRVERVYDLYRRYCAAISDTPLFDNLDAFIYALNAYSPCIDRTCADSVLREEDSTEHIVKLDIRKLRREGVQTFRS